MTKAGQEKAWSNRDLAGGFNGLRPDEPRKTPWALQRIYFKMEYILKYIVRTGYRDGLGQAAKIGHWEWQVAF